MKEIKFYYEYEEFGFLSNYWLAELNIEGKLWASVEHYYQSKKTLDPVFSERIRNAETCDDAKNLGNSDEIVIRDDWDDFKEVAMKRALIAKFNQHSDLKDLLLETGDAILIENSQKDYYWGIGADGSGKSRLGFLLMELREDLKR